MKGQNSSLKNELRLLKRVSVLGVLLAMVVLMLTGINVASVLTLHVQLASSKNEFSTTEVAIASTQERVEALASKVRSTELNYADISRSMERSHTLQVEATGYCPCAKCNGNSLCIARNGDKLVPNVSIAVDSSVIPLGSRCYVKGYGWREADDTGSAIKGNRIDILFATHEEALAFGRRQLEVLVFD